MNRRATFAVLGLTVAGAALGFWLLRQPAAPVQAPPAAADVVSIGHENDITTLDPVMVGDIFAFRITAQVFEGLLELDASGRAAAALAERWESNPAFDRWVFTLRDDVFFHESDVFGPGRTRKVTADDVVYSLERSLTATAVASFVLGDVVQGVKEFQAGQAQRVSGLRALDERRVEVRLVRPEAAFVHRLTSPYLAVFPREALAKGADSFARETPIGTGPYVASRVSDVEVVLLRNSRYWRPFASGAPRELRFRVIKNDQVRLAEFRNGNLHVVRVTPGLADAFIELPRNGVQPSLKPEWAGQATMSRAPTLSSFFVGFNTERVARQARRAFQAAVDRDQIVSVVTRGAATPRVGTLPTGLDGYGRPFEAPAAAAPSAPVVAVPTQKPIELLVHEQDGADVLGELVQAQLAKAGVAVTLKKLDFNTAIQRMVDGNFDALALSFQYVYSAPEPILAGVFHSRAIPSPNIWRYRNPAVDTLIDRLSATSDPATANTIVASIEAAVYEDAPALFLYQADNLFIVRSAFGSIPFSRYGVPIFTATPPR